MLFVLLLLGVELRLPAREEARSGEGSPAPPRGREEPSARRAEEGAEGGPAGNEAWRALRIGKTTRHLLETQYHVACLHRNTSTARVIDVFQVV